MSDVSALHRFEQRLEQMISGTFARAFRSAVQPVEISAALAREVDNSAQVLSRARRLVPNEFHVELSPTDHERLSSLGEALTGELVSMLHEHAAAQSYLFTGPVTLTLHATDDLTVGRFRVRSQAVAKVSQSSGAVTETQERRATAILEINGERLPLSPPGAVIGRGADADVRVNDPGVSRRHAELRVVDMPDGTQVSAYDLGSTNGMIVDGRRTDQAVLGDGSVIRLGNTTLTLHLKQV